MEPDGSLRNRQTETHSPCGAFSRVVASVEGLENLLKSFLRNAFAMIANSNDGMLLERIAHAFKAHLDLGSFGRVIYSITNDVLDRTAKQLLASLDRAGVHSRHPDKTIAVPRLEVGILCHLTYQEIEHHGARFHEVCATFQPSQFEKVSDEFIQAFYFTLHPVEGMTRFGTRMSAGDAECYA